MPEIEKIFPRAIEHLVKIGIQAQAQAEQKSRNVFPIGVLFQAAGLKPRRAHLESIFQKEVAKNGWSGEIHLPGGWKIKKTHRQKDKWILEREQSGEKNAK